MAVFQTAAEALEGAPTYKMGGKGMPNVATASVALATAPVITNTILMLKLPKGAVVYDGYLSGDDLDVNATEVIELDVGTEADPNAFLDSGVILGDAVAERLPAHADGLGFLLRFNGLLDGFETMTEETEISVTFVAAAATFAAGQLNLVVNYYVP